MWEWQGPFIQPPKPRDRGRGPWRDRDGATAAGPGVTGCCLPLREAVGDHRVISPLVKEQFLFLL